MTVYHYTTLSNWYKIKKEGLKPQIIHHAEIQRAIRECLGYAPEISGVWVWRRKQVSFMHPGHVLMVANHHPGAKAVVELALDIEEDDLYSLPKSRKRPNIPRRIIIDHDGYVDFGEKKIQYHKDEPANLVSRRIPPEKIRRLGTYRVKKAAIDSFQYLTQTSDEV